MLLHASTDLRASLLEHDEAQYIKTTTLKVKKLSGNIQNPKPQKVPVFDILIVAVSKLFQVPHCRYLWRCSFYLTDRHCGAASLL